MASQAGRVESLFPDSPVTGTRDKVLKEDFISRAVSYLEKTPTSVLLVGVVFQLGSVTIEVLVTSVQGSKEKAVLVSNLLDTGSEGKVPNLVAN